MKLLIDMNLTPAWVEFFDTHKIHSVHWSNVGNPQAPDADIFEFARENNFIVFTNDLDFGAILAATNAHSPSVFQLKSQELMPYNIGNHVIGCLHQYKSYLLSGSMLTFDIDKVRIRILPFR
jgi:predicted nuclease of predicted toxin-antitoxin system